MINGKPLPAWRAFVIWIKLQRRAMALELFAEQRSFCTLENASVEMKKMNFSFYTKFQFHTIHCWAQTAE
ncbi:hypothetical protein BOP93_15110 [Pseudomonas orientalis]|uniref:Uncharacterized protein n=1 Tax=Pseudomonas orientalis TaxID=76758 RepID=A0A2L0RXP1_9PSED|nr:hypothetical protein BOP93_15110 [Pseudomonas orientalis]